MRSTIAGLGVLAAGLLTMGACGSEDPATPDGPVDAALRPLPSPTTPAPESFEQTLDDRRSIRSFDGAALTEGQVGQLLWAAQGRTGPDGARAAPSAGATYPLEVLVVSAAGIARYHPDEHALSDHRGGDHRAALADAALGQEWIADAGVVVTITGVVERTAARYGEQAQRFMLLEAGHAAQNVLLQAVSLDLGATPVGAFDPDDLRALLDLPPEEEPLYLLPVGTPEQ